MIFDIKGVAENGGGVYISTLGGGGIPKDCNSVCVGGGKIVEFFFFPVGGSDQFICP